VIVSGEIFGKPWPAQHGGLPTARGYVLIGEEIGSEWAAHLDKFSGILACYGHANSHLGITARALGIPFRIVSQEQLEKFRAAAHFRYNG
jgi:signal transduction protein with GAF and PtsI domain